MDTISFKTIETTICKNESDDVVRDLILKLVSFEK